MEKGYARLSELRALARKLARVRLAPAERDLIERLDLLDLAAGNLRFAGTSTDDRERAEKLLRSLARATHGVLEHAYRSIPDDRSERLGDAGEQSWVVSAIEARPQPLAMVLSWRAGSRPPPRKISRLELGPLLGYPPCCVRFEEARRALLVRAEARGMVETWHARTKADLLSGIDARRPFLADDDEESRIARLRRFAFVSFLACPACCRKGAKSPAGRENARRGAVARAISPGFARRIERDRG